MHFGAQSRGLRTPCERFAPWVTPGPRITRFRLVADLGRMGLDTHRVSNKVSKITSRHLVLLDRAFPAHALVHGSSAVLKQAIVDSLVLLTAGGARSRHEVEGASEVQNEVSRGELAGVRASARAARRRDPVALCRRQGRVAPVAVRSPRWAEKVFRSRDHDHIDASARLPVAFAPSRGLLAVGPLLDGCRSRSARPHHAVSPRSAPRRRAAPRPGQRASPPHRR